MTLEPLFAHGPVIPVHAFAAMAAFGLGLVQLAAPKGTLPHRTLGYVWVVLMAVTVVTALFIHTIRQVGPFSWIHLLALWTAFGLWGLVRDARRRNVAAHRSGALWLFITALVVAGAFTFLPGRIMHQVVFG